MGLCTDPGLGVWARIRCLAGYPGSGPVPAWEHGLYTGFRPKYRALDLALFQAYPWISGIRAAGLYIRYTGLPAIQARIQAYFPYVYRPWDIGLYSGIRACTPYLAYIPVYRPVYARVYRPVHA